MSVLQTPVYWLIRENKWFCVPAEAVCFPGDDIVQELTESTSCCPVAAPLWITRSVAHLPSAHCHCHRKCQEQLWGTCYTRHTLSPSSHHGTNGIIMSAHTLGYWNPIFHSTSHWRGHNKSTLKNLTSSINNRVPGMYFMHIFHSWVSQGTQLWGENQILLKLKLIFKLQKERDCIS